MPQVLDVIERVQERTNSAIVLITDGANNTGQPTPFVAAEAARTLGVRIHTVGVSAPDTSALDDL